MFGLLQCIPVVNKCRFWSPISLLLLCFFFPNLRIVISSHLLKGYAHYSGVIWSKYFTLVGEFLTCKTETKTAAGHAFSKLLGDFCDTSSRFSFSNGNWGSKDATWSKEVVELIFKGTLVCFFSDPSQRFNNLWSGNCISCKPWPALILV